MTVASHYGFGPATPGDLARLRPWQSEPHLRTWWDDVDPYDDTDWGRIVPMEIRPSIGVGPSS